jgi:hypothetical protein
MSQHHLDDLQNALGQKGWRIVEKQPGNDYDISGSWVIQRSELLKIDFNGLDDMICLPIAQSYGCAISDRPDLSLYFTNNRARWKKSLKAFIDALDSLNEKISDGASESSEHTH